MTRFFAAFAFFLGACGGTSFQIDQAVEARDLDAALSAYDVHARASGHDDQALARVAGLLLESSARCSNCDLEQSKGLAESVVRQLRRAGLAGRPILRRIADGPLDWARVFSLRALASHDEIADAQLYGLAHVEEGEPFMESLVASLDANDAHLLNTLLSSEETELRKGAALQLAKLGCLDSAPHLFERFSEEDNTGVRSALTRAFASLLVNEEPTACVSTEPRSSASINAARLGLEAALSDEAARVRVAAVRGLIQSDVDVAIPRVTPWFSAPSSPSSIEAARVLLATVPDLDDTLRELATTHLLHASRGGEHQASALMAWFSIEEKPMDALLEQLRREQSGEAIFHLGRLLIDEDELAEERLGGILSTETMTGLQAAVVLAEHDNEAAENLIYAALDSEIELLRLVAVRYFASVQATHILRPLLEDPSDVVRFAAAGGALRAWNRGY